MPSTPPPTSARAHTPPTPLHGPRYDAYEPYSPRRSKRSTAHNNPYSSFHSDRSPNSQQYDTIATPATAKKARSARAPTQLSSPPSSPTSPATQRSARQPHKTPRKQLFASARTSAADGEQSDLEGSADPLGRSTLDSVTMLPTPSKTPKKHQAFVNSTARMLFQPEDPNDVMPTPRKIRKHRPQTRTEGFELYNDEESRRNCDTIEIFTDSNARIPDLDESEDNPFVGRKKTAPRLPRESRRRTREDVESDEKINEAVRNNEGMVYIFRGKKIFQRFADAEADPDTAGIDLAGSHDQLSLKHKAGTAAQRPLTRTAIKPRRLFQSPEQQQQQPADSLDATDDVDEEEAVTDVEMLNATASPAEEEEQLPKAPTTSPTARAMRSSSKKLPQIIETPVVEDADNIEEQMSVVTDSFLAQDQPSKKPSPFDSWQRTKSGRKRNGDTTAEASASGGKRSRSTGPSINGS